MALITLFFILVQGTLYLQARSGIWDPCSGLDCYNGGQCTAPADFPYCQCPIGFSGTHCEIKDGTLTDPCGGCAVGQVCKATGISCFTTPCPTHKCVASTDPCGGCPPGETCATFYPPCPYPPQCIDWDKQHPGTTCPYFHCDPVHQCVAQSILKS